MHIIKVNAINSTNSFARELFKEDPRLAPTCILAESQLSGRGQRGTIWVSAPGENLTFSLFFPAPDIPVDSQFLISALTATTLADFLEKEGIGKIRVKWPNDIMAANKKVAGILIENVIGNGRISGSVIGIGLNVNQTDFRGLPSAGSLRTVTGIRYDREALLKAVIQSFEEAFDKLHTGRETEILGNYREKLFRRNIPSTFRLAEGNLFSGIIEDVSASGKLLVRTEDEFLEEFDLKEVSLCF